MKKLLFILLLLFPFHLLAQIEMKNMNLKHPDSALLYIGVHNTIEILGLKDFRNVELKIKQGAVSSFEDGKFTVYANTSGTDTLKLYQNKKLLFSKAFKIKYIPDPKPQLGYITTQEATVSQILSNTKLYAVIPDCDYKHYLRITSFELQLYNPRNVLLINFGGTSGQELTFQQIEEIKKMRPGSKLIFENIKVTCPDCRARALNTLTITIK